MTAALGELVGIAPEPPYVRPAIVRVIIGGEIREFPNPEPTFVPTTRGPSSYCQACNVDFEPAGTTPGDDRTPQSHRRTWLCVGCDVATPIPSGDAAKRFAPIDPTDGTVGLKPWPAAEVLDQGDAAGLKPRSGPRLFADLLAGAGWTVTTVRTRGPWPAVGSDGYRVTEALSVRGASPTGHRAAAVWVADAAGSFKGEYAALQLRGDRVREVGLDVLKATLRSVALPPAPKAARPAKARKAPGAAVGGPTAPVQVPAAVEVPPAAAEPSAPVQASVVPGPPPAAAEPPAPVQVPAATVPKPRTRKAAAPKPTGRSRGAAYARGEAREDVCGGCRRPVLRGLDNDVAAADAVADPVLGWATDLVMFRRIVVALLMGRPVYAYDRRRLWAMDRHTLSRPGWHRVSLGHQCDDPLQLFPIPTNQGGAAE